MKKFALLLLAAGNAFAASGTVSYNGAISTTCSFSSQVNGSLGVDPSQPNILASNVGNATPATVGLTYFGTPTVSIEEISTFSTKPNGVANGDFTYTTSVASVAGKTYSSSSGYKTATYNSGSSDTLTINLTASKSSGTIAQGNYAASGTITCQ